MMVFFGVSSAITCTATSLQLVYDRTMFLLFMAAGSIIFYALFTVLETMRFGKLAGIGGLVLFYVALSFRFWEEIEKGIVTLVNNFLKEFMNFTGSKLTLLTYQNKEEVSVNFSTTLVLVILGVFVVAVVSAFFYRRRRSSVFIVATMPFMILPFYVGKIGSFIHVWTYLVVLIAVIGTRELKTNSTDRKIRQKLSAILITVGLISGALAYVIVPPSRYENNKDKLIETKNTISALATWDADEVFAWIKAMFNGDAMDYGKIGKQAKINHTGEILMKISGTIRPEYGLYLRGYVGDIYENNKWSSIKKDAQYKEDITALNALNITPDSYHVQLRNDIGDNERSGLEGIWQTGDLRLRNIAFGHGDYVIPVLPVNSYLTESNGRMKTRTPGVDYEEDYYTVYPYAVRRMLMTASEDLVDPVFWTTYEDKTKLLSEFAKKYYLQIPDNLQGICKEYKKAYKSVIKQYQEGGGDISDVLRTVRQFISNETTYTETPGKTPSGRDTVEYFLKESKKGYCTYYATAAAVLLRSVGIPTRYVEGLYVSSEELEKALPNEVEIPDYDAHAWIEVFDERYGFVTFETTPGQGEQLGEENSDSGYDGNGDGDNGNSAPESITPTPIASETPEESMEFEDIDGNEDPNEPVKDTAKTEDSGIWRVLGLVALGIILIVVMMEVQRRLRRYFYRKNLADMKNKRKRIRMTHRHLVPYFTKQGVTYRGQSTGELTHELSKALKIKKPVIGFYVDMVYHAAFGPDDITEDQMFRFRSVCDEISRHAYKNAGIFRKLYYMYFMVL